MTPKQLDMPGIRQSEDAISSANDRGYFPTGGIPSDPGSDWVRTPRSGYTLRGLSRPVLWALIRKRAIKTCILKQPLTDAQKRCRGVRLVKLSSLDDYLENLASQQGS
jgi:hypothetical protein